MSRRILAVVVMAACCASACSPGPAPSATAPPSATASAVAPSTPSAAPTPTASPAPTVTTGGLTWLPLGATESTTVTVPLDYGHPAAGTIALAVIRRPATDPAKRIGTLFLNPGGPGAPGVPLLSRAPGLLPPEVLSRFDLVSWDPRGVGLSEGVTCPAPSAVTRVESLDPMPSTPEAIAAYRAAFDQVAADCQAASGDLLPYLSEANTARDMDAIRAAMGEPAISYWGWSYGTYLGYLYATLFPTRLRAAVLDGPVDPTLDLAGRDDGQARGFEIAFAHELALCSASAACPFHNGGAADSAYTALMAQLDRQPISVPGMGTLGPGEAQTGILTYLYSGDPLPLMQALADAQAGDGTQLLSTANAYYAQVQLGAYLATTCLDVAHRTSPTSIAEALAATSAQAPRFAAEVVLTDAYGCLDWPVPAAPVAVGPPPQGLPPILILASSFDPATPPWQAQPLADALGTGVVLMRNGIGHTTDGSMRHNACLSTASAAYMLDLTLPAAGTVCTDPPPFTR